MTKSDLPERPGVGVGLGRRELIELLGASAALAGLGACTQSPREKIFPHSQRAAGLTPGLPVQYATSMVLDGFAVGVLARSHEGRPTKIEGNPEHPASLGATSAYEQASVLDLYDPHRVKAVHERGVPSSWQAALAALDRPSSFRPWIILPPQSSPLVAQLLRETRRRFPACRVSFHAPIERGSVYRASRSVFGRALDARLDLRRARVVLSLGADFLSAMPMSLRWARDFSAGHRQTSPGGAMSRLYVVEPMLTPTGSVGDHRLAVPPSELPRVAAAILRELVAAPSEILPEQLWRALPPAADSPHQRFITAVANDLRASRADAVVIAGDQAGAETQVLAHALNAVLGSTGRTVAFSEPALIEPEGGAPLAELTRAIDAREVDAVLILDANPVYSADADLELGRRLLEVPSTLHLTYVENETSDACKWVLPLAHYLESWGDARAYDGTVSFVQPLIEPLFPARSVVELLGSCAGRGDASGHRLLSDYWRREIGAGFDAAWAEHLKLGFVPGSALPEERGARADLADAATWVGVALQPPSVPGIELNFRPSPSLYDGRFASNAWLLEMPHPMTKQSWGNAAIVSPSTAQQLGVRTGHVVDVAARGRSVEAPVLVLPGHADGVVTLELGYGQRGAVLGRGHGVSAYPLRAAGASHQSGAVVRATHKAEKLAITQDHADARGRPLALVAALAEYQRHPDFTEPHRTPPLNLLPMYEEPKRSAPAQWAMTIDTTLCTGCSACVIACQAENNVPVVGKEDVERGREMHWLRIDRYFSGPPEQPEVVNQPMLCQHCEKAPCEYVCPVNATVHSPDGLNEMVYNRCIGTRFCSNNCPYKVRRFNWFEYTADSSTQSMQRNPDVTVRDRGVMEKCTYCVQRIRRTEMRARMERREIEPGEVVTACAQACAVQAIQFGALEHEDTKMVQWRREPRAYFALNDLGTRPRTQYLARIVNTNPELDE